MKKAILLAATGVLAVPAFVSAQFSQVAIDQFDGSGNVPFTTVTEDPVGSGDATYTETSLSALPAPAPSLTPPAGGDGDVLLISANNAGIGVQRVYNYIDVNTVVTGDDYAVEALQIPFVADTNSGGATTWGGLGIRMDATFQNGYYFELRTDNSASFGNYASVYARTAGEDDFLGRIYFDVGVNGLQGDFDPLSRSPEVLGDFVASVEVSDDAPVTNTYVPARIEAVGSVISFYLGDLSSPVMVYNDPTPITTGGAVVFHQDPFGGSTTTPADSAASVFDYVAIDEYSAPASTESWDLYE